MQSIIVLDAAVCVGYAGPIGAERIVHGQSRNLVANCVGSIVRRSTYPDYEIVCVVDESTDEDAWGELVAAGRDRLRIVPYRERFNFAFKLAAASTSGRR